MREVFRKRSEPGKEVKNLNNNTNFPFWTEKVLWNIREKLKLHIRSLEDLVENFNWQFQLGSAY